MERPIIPNRVPLAKPGGSGPKVQISKFPMIKKDMDNGSQAVVGPGGARQQRTAAPDTTSDTGNMIQVRMDGGKSTTIARPRVQAAPALPPPPEFRLEHAVLCRLLINERLEALVANPPEDGDDETNAEVNNTRTIEINIATSAAEALDAMIESAQAPAQAKPAARNGAPMRAVIGSPRAQFPNVAPRRTVPVPRATAPTGGALGTIGMPPDLAAVVRGDHEADADGTEAPADEDAATG